MALVTIRRSPSVQTPRKPDETGKSDPDVDNDDVESRISKSLNECYFANKGAALVLESGCAERRRSPARVQPQPDIQHHLQSMFYLLRPEETLKMAVKLESVHAGRTRYLVVVCRSDEAALLGIDCNERTTVGLVLRVLADTAIKLDGDGGFSVCVCNRQHIFKPVSVQAMWSALQTLHRASGRARELNHFWGGASHAWCSYYEKHVDSDRSCLNEWHAMDNLESRRPPSPDSLRHKPRERDETERVIRSTLKEIMMSVDLDEVTSKAIRGRLEDDLDMDLAEYKSFIDQEMITILGQMDAPTEIFEHVYLGSEWNASNLEELQRNGVRHILNVTREIDNFFPGMFDYLNVRVYDDDKTDLLKHWDNTFKYINKARSEGSKVLVHCKMGISRSASVVIAYAMKAYNWNFDKALKHVKTKRSCIKPNTNFLNQLETYQGILDAMKNKEKLQRSKSETNLKSPKCSSKSECKTVESSPLTAGLSCGGGGGGGGGSGGGGGGGARGWRGWRPRSWSPQEALAGLHAPHPPPTSLSCEHLPPQTRHMLMPYANGTYSVSPNQIIRLKEDRTSASATLSVKHIVSEIENNATQDRRDARRQQRLNFGAFNEPSSNRSSNASVVSLGQPEVVSKPPQPSPSRNSYKFPHSNFEPDKIHTWDPGEVITKDDESGFINSDSLVKSDSGFIDAKSKNCDALCNCVDRSVEEEGSEETATSRHRWSVSGERGSGRGQRRCASSALDISDNVRKFNETCAILKELASAAERMERARDRGASTWSGRLCASAPECRRTAPRRRRLPAAASQPDLPRAGTVPAASASPGVGIVSNLKKEFEARSEGEGGSRRGGGRVGAATTEDLSVKVLVGRYDGGGRARCESLGHSKKSRLTGEGGEASRRALHHSFCGVLHRPDRPPPAPNVVSMATDYPNVLLSTVMSKAQNKKQLQHGKTHPLTRLNINRSNNRCSNPVYNTM